MKAWGVAIPGLGMSASELPRVEGLLVLENPDVGIGRRMPVPYRLEDVAEHHLSTIKTLEIEAPFTVIGMSMGGMIASILATRFRAELPRETRFRFLVTSPNLARLPAVTDEMLTRWKIARAGDEASFRRVLEPFLAPGFCAANPEAVTRFIRHRASGGNLQTPREFMRQVAALRTFDGEEFFSRVDPEASLFIGGAEDTILGPAHSAALRELCPRAPHLEVDGLGHMINVERPEYFHRQLPAGVFAR